MWLFIKKYGGLHFILSCNYNYHVKDLKDIPSFYKDILMLFNELTPFTDAKMEIMQFYLIIETFVSVTNIRYKRPPFLTSPLSSCFCFSKSPSYKGQNTRIQLGNDKHSGHYGKPNSIDQTFLQCQFTKYFTKELLQWFNADNNSNFNLNTEYFLFGPTSVLSVLTKKFNYTLLFLRYYIYKRKGFRMTHHL